MKFILKQCQETMGRITILDNLKDLELYTRCESDEVKEKSLGYLNKIDKEFTQEELKALKYKADFKTYDAYLCINLFFITLE